MLRYKLLVRLLRLPCVQRLLHRAGEAVLVADDEVPAVQRWILRVGCWVNLLIVVVVSGSIMVIDSK